MAIDNGFDFVICGHIHEPAMRTITNHKGSCVYLNSGDWIENLTALEYNNESWRLFKYHPETYTLQKVKITKEEVHEDPGMLSAFQLLSKM